LHEMPVPRGARTVRGPAVDGLVAEDGMSEWNIASSAPLQTRVL